MFEYWIFLHYQKNFWEQPTKCYKVTCFPKLENWHVLVATLYRFHSIHMTILFDLSSVLTTFVFGNNLIKRSFEAKVNKSNWKLKTMLFSGSFGSMFKQCQSTIIAVFYKKLTGKDLGYSSDDDE